MERTFNGIDIGLNVAVNHIASRLFPCGFNVASEAPDTLEKLSAAFDAHKYTVWNGASDRTIFDDNETNYAFRAWHDWHHWHGQLPFTPEGEARACREQCLDLVKVYGRSPRTAQWCRILDAEINGQLRYSQQHDGAFPTDQKAFVLAYLDNPEKALSACF